MSSTTSTSRAMAPHRVNDRVHVRQHGLQRVGRISSIHRRGNGIEYVVRLDAANGGLGPVINAWTNGRRSRFLTVAPPGRNRSPYDAGRGESGRRST
jgi:hypothetical protein